MGTDNAPLTREPTRVSDGIEAEDAPAPIDGATWYTGQSREDELVYEFEAGALADASYLTFDLLLDGQHLAKWELRLQEGDDGPSFRMRYGALNQCQARARVPTEAVNQDRWLYHREGAWLKPTAGGDRVDLERVDRMTITLVRKADHPVRWCQTPVTAVSDEPEPLDHPHLPEGELLDEFGQSSLHEWEGRTESEGELVDRLESQLADASDHSLPGDVSEWGGWTGREFEATGFFRTEHDGERWWLVDPDGHPFWSAGIDCVRSSVDAVHGGLDDALTWVPDDDDPAAARDGPWNQRSTNYLAANFIRAFGADEWYDRWAEITLGQLRRLGFNTVGNWSEWEIARDAGYPYVRPLRLEFPGTETIYRDFPDVYADTFRESAAEFAAPLEETANDPALVGYFLGNEPEWGFATETPAAGMLYTTETCVTRERLREFFEERYESEAALADAWGMDVDFSDLESGRWRDPLTDDAADDLEDFSEVMVDEFYRVLSEEAERVDPNHLNLGTRYAGVPEDWALEGMNHVDVFSINCYDERVKADAFARISELLDAPVMIGEWHFGALDVGLPASGIGRVHDQEARGDAYRVYFEDAAARPWCVGVHWFTLYDQSAIGRFDGENYNIGFLDTCNRAYDPIAEAARESHGRLYDVAAGDEEPYDDEPEYLSRVF